MYHFLGTRVHQTRVLNGTRVFETRVPRRSATVARAELAFDTKKCHMILEFKKLKYYVSLYPSFYNSSINLFEAPISWVESKIMQIDTWIHEIRVLC